MPSYGALPGQTPANPEDEIKPMQIGGAETGGASGASGESPTSPAPGAAPAAQPSMTGTTPNGATMQQGTGFNNLQNVLSANSAGATQLAGNLTNEANQRGMLAQSEIKGTLSKGDDATWGQTQADRYGLTGDREKDTQSGQDFANRLTSQSGLQSILQDQYKGLSYTAGQSGLDSFLAGQAGGPAFQQAQSAYGNLTQQLSDYDSSHQQGAAITPADPVKLRDPPSTPPLSGNRSPGVVKNNPLRRRGVGTGEETP